MVKPMTGRLNKAKELKDARVRVLRGVIDLGRAASYRLPDLKMSLKGLEAYEATNRVSGLDRPEEGEDTVDTLRAKIDCAQSEIAAADKAQIELKEIARFYRAYHIVVYGPKIKELKQQLNAAEYWAEQWQSRIWALDLDTDKDIDERAQEKDIMEYECARARDEVSRLQIKLSELRNMKYM